MRKTTAYALLTEAWGLTATDVPAMAKLLGITPQAIYKWPDKLTEVAAARVALCVARGRAQQLKAQGIALHPLEEDAVAQ